MDDPKEERERKGAGFLLPGSDAGQAAGTALRGLEALARNRWLGWLVTTAVGKGLLLGFALVGTTFFLVRVAEKHPQQMPADPALSGIPSRRHRSSAASRTAWGLAHEGLSGGIPAKANMYVEQEPGASLAGDTGAPSEYGTKVKDVPEGKAAKGKDAEAMAQEVMDRMGIGSTDGLKPVDGFEDSEGIEDVSVSPGGAAGLLARAKSALRGTTDSADGGGKTSGMQRGRRPVLSALKGGRAMRSSRAAGQLKVAHALSGQGKLAGGNEPAAAYADAAFNQQTVPTGGAGISLGDPISGGGVGGGSGSSGGGGGGNSMPNPSVPIRTPQAPPIGPARNVTPYQPLVNMANDLQDQAASLKQTGTLLIALGAALIVAGLAIMNSAGWTGIGAVIGAMLVAVGGLLVYQGMDMVSQAKGMADQSKGLADQVDRGYGQQRQSGIIRRRADESVK